MNRKEALSRVGLLLGGALVGSSIFLESGCKSNPKQVNDLFNQDQVNLFNEIAETILPATTTPGAKEAKVGEFMTVMVKDCYTKADQQIFLEGLIQIDEECKNATGNIFLIPIVRSAPRSSLNWTLIRKHIWKEKSPSSLLIILE